MIYALAIHSSALFTYFRIRDAELDVEGTYKGICRVLPKQEDMKLDEHRDSLFGDSTLGYKLSTYTPLLLASRQVHAEVKQLLIPLNAKLHSLVKQSVLGDAFRKQALHPLFLDLCADSRLELGTDAAESMAFLGRMADPVRLHIKSLVIGPRNMMADDAPAREAWSKDSDISFETPFTEAVRLALPALREVALWVPDNYEGYEWYCYLAPMEMGELLVANVIESLQLFFIANLSITDILKNSTYTELQRPWFGKPQDRFEVTIESTSMSDEKTRIYISHSATSMKVKTVVTLRNSKK